MKIYKNDYDVVIVYKGKNYTFLDALSDASKCLDCYENRLCIALCINDVLLDPDNARDQAIINKHNPDCINKYQQIAQDTDGGTLFYV